MAIRAILEGARIGKPYPILLISLILLKLQLKRFDHCFKLLSCLNFTFIVIKGKRTKFILS